MSIKDRARELMGEKVDGVVGCRVADGSHVPHLFGPDDIDGMTEEYPAGERYPLSSIVRRLQEADPGMRLAVVARGCDERALVELAKQGQVDFDRVEIIGLACDAYLAGECECGRPYPSSIDEGEKVEGAEGRGLARRIESMPSGDRLAYWLSRFGACIKCRGCRNVCPLCYCKECALDDPGLVGRGEVPPAEPAFHLVRALDMAGRCIDCGLCEEACPMGIPLRTLYRKVGDVVYENFGYRPGREVGEKSPLAVLGTDEDMH